MNWYDDIRTLVAEGYEVGWGYKGHPTPEEKVSALNEMLERHGADPAAWLVRPTIRYHHADTVETDWFINGNLAPLDTCYWAVHGVLKDKPETGHIPEGVRLPIIEDRETGR
jgi:hypothetical protein